MGAKSCVKKRDHVRSGKKEKGTSRGAEKRPKKGLPNALIMRF